MLRREVEEREVYIKKSKEQERQREVATIKRR